MPKIQITRAGRKRLINELKELKHVKRPEVIERIKTARALGDLSENAEWDEARNQQSFIEGRIKELEEKIKNSVVVEKGSGHKVAMGSEVEVRLNGQTRKFTIVSNSEVDPINGKISPDSPIGKALMGKGKGDKFVASTPDGEVNCQIISLS